MKLPYTIIKKSELHSLQTQLNEALELARFLECKKRDIEKGMIIRLSEINHLAHENQELQNQVLELQTQIKELKKTLRKTTNRKSPKKKTTE